MTETMRLAPVPGKESGTLIYSVQRLGTDGSTHGLEATMPEDFREIVGFEDELYGKMEESLETYMRTRRVWR